LGCVTLALLFIVVVALFWVFQRSLIYAPSRSLTVRRQTALPRAREVTLRTGDGLSLGGWFLDATGSAARRTVVLVFDGNAGDRSLRASLASAIATSGAAVLLFDYRGYGGNPGAPTERGLRQDALAARGFVDHLAGYESARVVYYGESLGTGVALGLASERPPDAIILRSPFPSLAEVGRIHYPLLPVRLMLRDRYEGLAWASSLRCPALVIAGGSDRVIPETLSRKVFGALAGPKQFLLVPNADHNDAELIEGPRVTAAMSEFLTSLPASS